MIKRNRNVLFLERGTYSPTAEIGTVKAEGHKSNLTIGAHSFWETTFIALHEKINIGTVCINDGVQLLTASHDVSDPLGII
jgi:hypothetical protein